MNPQSFPAGDFDQRIVNGAIRSLTGLSMNVPPPPAGTDRGTMFLVNEDRLVVVVSGGLWVENAKAFQSAVLGEIKDSIRAVDLELSGLMRFDTWALCTLLSLRRYFSARHFRFRLIDPSPRVAMILDMTKTRQLFEVVQTGAALPEAGGMLDARSSKLSRAG